MKRGWFLSKRVGHRNSIRLVGWRSRSIRRHALRAPLRRHPTRPGLIGIASEAEAEVLVLRHELSVLRRQIKGPKLRRRDRLFLAAMSRTLARERSDHVLVVGRRHLARVLREYATHHNSHRPHRALDLRCPDDIGCRAPGAEPERPEAIERRNVLSLG